MPPKRMRAKQRPDKIGAPPPQVVSFIKFMIYQYHIFNIKFMMFISITISIAVSLSNFMINLKFIIHINKLNNLQR